MRSETPDTYYVNNDWHGVKVGPGPRDAGLFMGGYLNYMYAFVCGNCLAKTYCFLPSIGQLTMPKFFLPNICLQWYQQKNTAYSIQLSACLKSYKRSQLYNQFRR